MKKHIRWLYGELPGLVKEGVLSEAYAQAMRDYYGTVKWRSKRTVALTICSILGAVLIGAGIILVFGHNWHALSRSVRTVLAILPLLVAQIGGGWCLARGKTSIAWRESVSTFIMLMIASAIALIGQTYHIPGNLKQFLFVWMVLSLPLIYIFQAVLPCLLYLAGITGWACAAQYEGGHALLFWILYAGAVPFVWHTMRRDRFSVSSGILGWGICLQAAWIGVTLEKVMPGLWIVVYLSLFAALYLIGAYWFDDAPSGWQKPMQLVGAGAIVVVMLILTYEWPWDDVGWRHWHCAYRYHAQVAWVDYLLALLLPVSALCLMATAARRGQLWRLWYGAGALVGSVGFLLAAATSHEMICVLLANGYVFLLGLATVVYGIRHSLIGTINGGMIVFSALILLRFFDEEFSFLVKGCAFILLGLGFLVTNLVLVRRMRKEVHS